jgi:hypothetical protein
VIKNSESISTSREILEGNTGLQSAVMEPTQPFPSDGERWVMPVA